MVRQHRRPATRRSQSTATADVEPTARSNSERAAEVEPTPCTGDLRFLFAAASDELALESSKLENGFFSEHFTKALEDGDGFDDAFDAARRGTRNSTAGYQHAVSVNLPGTAEHDENGERVTMGLSCEVFDDFDALSYPHEDVIGALSAMEGRGWENHGTVQDFTQSDALSFLGEAAGLGLGEGDALYLHVASHGAEGEDGGGYTACADTRRDDLAGTALGIHDVASRMCALAGAGVHVTVVMDQCHAGAGVNTVRKEAGPALTAASASTLVGPAALAPELERLDAILVTDGMRCFADLQAAGGADAWADHALFRGLRDDLRALGAEWCSATEDDLALDWSSPSALHASLEAAARSLEETE